MESQEHQRLVNQQTSPREDESDGSSHVVVIQDHEKQQSCINKLRAELTCAICLDLCYEPSTTPCGHSFCRKCLKSSINKGHTMCPKCRKSISYDEPLSVNIVIWNTVQIFFPDEVKAKKIQLQKLKKPPPLEFDDLHPVLQFIFGVFALVIFGLGFSLFCLLMYMALVLPLISNY